MNSPSLSTRFATWRPRNAGLVLAGTIAAIGVCLAVSLTAPSAVTATAPLQPGRSDFDFYRRVTEEVRAGRNYYRVLPPLFAEFQFTPFSLFNYRTPIYAWLIGGLPGEEWAQAILAGLAVLTLALAFGALRREVGGPGAAVGAFLLLGGLVWCFLSLGIFSQELWAGTLITMSICLYALGRWPWAVLAGLAALFFRELSLPYVAIALAWAAWRRRPAETAAWGGGLTLYMAFMVWHLVQAARLVPDSPKGHALSWVAFGGLPFVLDTCRMNFALLVLLPTWAAAFYLPLALLGLAGWRGEMGTRVGLTVAAYLAAFAVVGQPFNLYWGLMDAPLLSLGLLWMPLALRDLGRCLTKSSAKPLPSSA